MDSLEVALADPKDARAIPRVDGPQGGWPALSLSVDTYRARAGARNTGPRSALTENTGVAVAFANPMDSLAVAPADPKDSRAIPRVDGPQRGRPALSLGIDTY